MSVLEVLVNLDLTPELLPQDYVLMRVDLSALPGKWLEDGPIDQLEEADSRAFGDRWIEEGRTPVLRVKSTIVPESHNLVLNPNHPSARNIPKPSNRPFKFDPRLT